MAPFSVAILIASMGENPASTSNSISDLDYHQVRILADGDRSDPLVISQVDGSIQRGDPDRFDGGESRVHQQLDFPLIAESRQPVPFSGGVWAGNQQSACLHELALQSRLVLVARGPVILLGGPRFRLMLQNEQIFLRS